MINLRSVTFLLGKVFVHGENFCGTLLARVLGKGLCLGRNVIDDIDGVSFVRTVVVLGVKL